MIPSLRQTSTTVVPASACRSAARRAVEPSYKGVARDDPVNGAVGFRVVYAPTSKG